MGKLDAEGSPRHVTPRELHADDAAMPIPTRISSAVCHEDRESRLLRNVDRFFVADRLREVARLLGLRKGATFQARAYARAASVVEAVPSERFEDLLRAERLEELTGIGPSVARQVASFAK